LAHTHRNQFGAIILRKRRVSAEIAEDTNGFGVDGFICQIADRAPNPERRYALSEEERILKQAIQSPALREVVKIQQLEECSLRETAETMGISVSAAKGGLFHAKAALRKSSDLRRMYQARSGLGMPPLQEIRRRAYQAT
jgi:DNA-directed RNA polymerase specialized sigma24 family protein